MSRVDCISCDVSMDEDKAWPMDREQGAFFCLDCAPCHECGETDDSSNVNGVPLCTECAQGKWEEA